MAVTIPIWIVGLRGQCVKQVSPDERRLSFTATETADSCRWITAPAHAARFTGGCGVRFRIYRSWE